MNFHRLYDADKSRVLCGWRCWPARYLACAVDLHGPHLTRAIGHGDLQESIRFKRNQCQSHSRSL